MKNRRGILFGQMWEAHAARLVRENPHASMREIFLMVQRIVDVSYTE